ncbi:MAG: site-2 protease family protein [Clostridia bacterium]|nr:site-2 protease family protein [Clostridia bacterium]
MFNLGFDKKTITIVLVVMLGLWLISSGTNGILNLLLTIPGVLIALTFHEFAHAYAANKLGDETPKLQGRLNLNPLSHIDPVGFVFLIVAGFGWGKPVQIDPRNFNGKYSISKAEAIVSAAGPIMNFILAFIFTAIYYVLFSVTDILNGLSFQWQQIVYQIVMYTITINIGLGVFNLIPLPPLDGSKILMNFLSYNAKQWFYNNQQIFYIVFLLIWITGLAGTILTPIFSVVLSGIDWVVYNIFKLLTLL